MPLTVLERLVRRFRQPMTIQRNAVRVALWRGRHPIPDKRAELHAVLPGRSSHIKYAVSIRWKCLRKEFCEAEL